ncbi:MAG: ankyrin repeat domain-containing protein, partial [Cyclobacteriaceae bacterium]|nr:ankyrin repeat domain-containing protein [Cyclobacteriaceae bacterium]
ILRGRDGMSMLLLEKGAPLSYISRKGETLLHLACENEKTDVARVLINKGLDVNAQDNDGETPMHASVRGGKDNLDIVKLLLDNDADINARNKKGQTVLKRAKGKKVKKYLADKGAVEE